MTIQMIGYLVLVLAVLVFVASVAQNVENRAIDRQRSRKPRPVTTGDGWLIDLLAAVGFLLIGWQVVAAFFGVLFVIDLVRRIAR